MQAKISPIAGIIIAVVVLCGILVVGVKMMGGKSDGGSEGKAVIVRPDNPNDPKFTEHLPAGIAGGGIKSGE